MPNQDKTGPLGQGPATGKGLGPCGRGLGLGKKFGKGFCRFASLSDYKKALEQELENIKTQEESLK